MRGRDRRVALGHDPLGQVVADVAHRAERQPQRRVIWTQAPTSNIAFAPDALRSGPRTSTPWRRASCTRVWGE